MVRLTQFIKSWSQELHATKKVRRYASNFQLPQSATIPYGKFSSLRQYFPLSCPCRLHSMVTIISHCTSSESFVNCSAIYHVHHPRGGSHKSLTVLQLGIYWRSRYAQLLHSTCQRTIFEILPLKGTLLQRALITGSKFNHELRRGLPAW